MSFFVHRVLRFIPMAFWAVIVLAASGFSQELDVRDPLLGPVVEPSYPVIDYIRIAPIPGNNIRPGSGCTRVYGGGLEQWTHQFRAYGWNNGPNGIPEGGGGDDIRVGVVRAQWWADVPPEIGSIIFNGQFTSDSDVTCGEGAIVATFQYFRRGTGYVTMSDTSWIAKLPPDWVSTAPQDLRVVGSDKE